MHLRIQLAVELRDDTLKQKYHIVSVIATAIAVETAKIACPAVI